MAAARPGAADVLVEAAPFEPGTLAAGAFARLASARTPPGGTPPSFPPFRDEAEALRAVRDAAVAGVASARRLAREAGTDVRSLDAACRAVGVGGLWDLEGEGGDA